MVLLGKVLANAALKTVPYLTSFPNYGAEVRGGESNCQVILSSHEIASPIASKFEAMVLMDQASASKYLKSLARDGIAIVNSSLCNNIPSAPNIMTIPATSEAEQLGDGRAANFIMLGALLAQRPWVKPSDIEQALSFMLKGKSPAVHEINLKALQRGLTLGAP